MKKILLIEDNAMNIKLVSEILEVAGYASVVASDAAKGLELAREQKPDLILMDVQLPGMDGLTATAELKRDERTRHIPVIAMTGFAMTGDEERVRQAGCDAYIAKPFRYHEFLGALNTLLAQGGTA